MSDLCNVLSSMLNYSESHFFMRHEAQGLPSYTIDRAFCSEETKFKRTCRTVLFFDVLDDVNLISSHGLHRVKVMNDQTLNLKAQIAPNGNEYWQRPELCSDCSMCSPVGVYIPHFTAALRKRRLNKSDVRAVFLQTGCSSKHVNVIPPRKTSDHKNALWLLLTAASGLVNANAKFQLQSDNSLSDIGFLSITVIPQLFLLQREGSLAVFFYQDCRSSVACRVSI